MTAAFELSNLVFEMAARDRPAIREAGLASIALCALALSTGCVASAQHRAVVEERDRLSRENLELRRSLAEQKVRAQEALEALRAQQTSDSPGAEEQTQAGGAAGSTGAPSGGILPNFPGAERMPVGMPSPSPSVVDEDVRDETALKADESAGAEGVLRVARRYGATGKQRQAIDAYTRLIQDYPFSSLLPEAFLERGRLRLSSGDRAGALADFDTIVEAFPRSSVAAEARRQGAGLRGR